MAVPPRHGNLAQNVDAELRPKAVARLGPYTSADTDSGGHMGAWDVGIWDNDEAADWLGDLEELTDLSLIEASLNPTEAGGSYLEAPEGTHILCAGDTLLAALVPGSSTAPDRVVTWVANNRHLGFAGLRKIAASKVLRVLGKDSEIQQLWEENDDLYSAWKARVEAIAIALASN
jgi:hypothetical protein